MYENKSEILALQFIKGEVKVAPEKADMLFPHRSEKNDKTAFLHLHNFASTDIASAWQEHKGTMIRYREPTLQRLYKLMKPR